MERVGKNRQEARPGTAARRAGVLAGALECFVRKGVEGTTIQDIQRTTGCSVGSLYHHFGSKEGIAEVLFIESIQIFNARMLERIEQAPDVAAGVKAVVRHCSEWAIIEQSRARYLNSRDVELSEVARARLSEMQRDFLARVFAWFAPHVAAGAMRVLPRDTYVPLITGPIQEYVRRWLSGHYVESPASVQEVFADAAWQAVCGRRVGEQADQRRKD